MAYEGMQGQQTQLLFPAPRQLFTPAVTVLLILLAAGFILQTCAPAPAVSLFGLDPGNVLPGRLWQLATYPFLNDVGGLIMTGLMLLFLGSAIEREWRGRSFAALWLVVSVTCGLIWVAVCLLFRIPAVGAGGAACVYGLIGAYGLVFRRQAGWPLAPHHMALLLLVIGILMSLQQPITLIWLSGALVAYLYIRMLWRIREGLPGKQRKEVGRFRDME